jgi:hypothetical protein
MQVPLESRSFNSLRQLPTIPYQGTDNAESIYSGTFPVTTRIFFVHKNGVIENQLWLVAWPYRPAAGELSGPGIWTGDVRLRETGCIMMHAYLFCTLGNDVLLAVLLSCAGRCSIVRSFGKGSKCKTFIESMMFAYPPSTSNSQVLYRSLKDRIILYEVKPPTATSLHA